MKVNFAPYVDLFSILALGLLIILTLVSGSTEHQKPKVSYTVVKAYFARSDSMKQQTAFSKLSDVILIEPYFIVGDVTMTAAELSIDIDIARNFDGLTIMLRGSVDNLRVGFRVAEIRSSAIFGELSEYRILSYGSGSKASIGGNYEVGQWIDPIINVSG